MVLRNFNVSSARREDVLDCVVSAVECNDEEQDALDGEDGANGQKLAGEDLDDDERERQLPQRGPQICALKCTLRC